MSGPTFLRLGGSRHLRLDTFADLLLTCEVDPAHWVVNTCAVSALRGDAAFFACLDADSNGIIRVDEVKQAIRWLDQHTTDHQGIVTGSATIDLTKLTDPELQDLAQRIRENAKDPQAHDGAARPNTISLKLIQAENTNLAASGANGDGIVTLEAITDAPDQVTLLGQVAQTVGTATDSTGGSGVTDELIQAFRASRQRYLELAAETPNHSAWGQHTAAVVAIVNRLTEALDAWFLWHTLASRDPEHIPAAPTATIAAWPDTAGLHEHLQSLPVAPMNLSGLPWEECLPGPWQQDLQELWQYIDADESYLTPAQWAELKTAAATYQKHIESLSAEPVASLGENVLREIELEGLDKLSQRCLDDAALAPLFQRLQDLEKIALLQRDLLRFARSFISLTDLYTAKPEGLFDQGELIMGGWRYGLCLHVDDPKKHAKLAKASHVFLLYITATRKETEQTLQRQLVVPVTNGDEDEYYVGRPGLFIDVDGKEFATVVNQVVAHPIAMRKALQRPFIKMGQFIAQQIEKWSANSDKAFDAELSKLAKSSKQSDATSGANSGNGMAQLLMGGGVALAALSSAFAFVVHQLSSMGPQKFLLGVTSLLALVLVPTALITWLQLRKRNLALVLEAGGWAINDRLKLDAYLSDRLTRQPNYPKGSRHSVGRNLQLRRRHLWQKCVMLSHVIRQFWWLLALMGLTAWLYYRLEPTVVDQADHVTPATSESALETPKKND